MAFRDDVFKQAGGRCQCIMKACSDHTGRCNAMLRGDWEIHRTTAGEAYTLSSVKAMCQTCHVKLEKELILEYDPECNKRVG